NARKTFGIARAFKNTDRRAQKTVINKRSTGYPLARAVDAEPNRYRRNRCATLSRCVAADLPVICLAHFRICRTATSRAITEYERRVYASGVLGVARGRADSH